MQLNSQKQPSVTQPYIHWSNQIYNYASEPEYQPNTWVQLLELPSTYSFDEALLLCQLGKDQWLAWVPDHGEAVFYTHQFQEVAIGSN